MNSPMKQQIDAKLNCSDSIQVALSLPERVAQLEERTKTKPKSLLDKIKEWGGVATAVIAVAYTFPTGVWEKWFQPEIKAREDLRSMVEQTTMVLSEGLKASINTSDKQAASQLNRYYTTRAYLIMERYAESLEKYSGELSASELLVVGTNFGIVNRQDEALKFLERSILKAKKSADQKIRHEQFVTYLQANRMKAGILFAPGVRQDIKKGRSIYKTTIQDARSVLSMQEQLSLLDLQGEWAYMEFRYGDWVCGQEMLKQAQETYNRSSAKEMDRGQLQAVLDITANVPMRPGFGCS
jgi:hypothetical protein